MPWRQSLLMFEMALPHSSACDKVQEALGTALALSSAQETGVLSTGCCCHCYLCHHCLARQLPERCDCLPLTQFLSTACKCCFIVLRVKLRASTMLSLRSISEIQLSWFISLSHSLLSFFFFPLVVLGIEHRALYMLGKCFPLRLYSMPSSFYYLFFLA